MQKSRTVVTAAILIGAVIIVIGIALGIILGSDKTESYRSILVYELDGSAEIERNGNDAINAFENLYLESGDRVKTGADSFMRLKLDNDKYIMVEEKSVFRIEATGNEVDSKTSIYLEQGAITNEIQNKLSDDSEYEVTTPNAVMAVRGTIFRIEIYCDENGDKYTKLSTYEGEVVVHLVYLDGTTGEEVKVTAGKEVVVHSDETITEYLGDPSNIDYQDCSLDTLYILKELLDNGSALTGITQEKVEEMIEERSNGNAGPDAEPDVEPDTEPDAKPDAEQTVHTVTFLYEGKVFGTQTVEDGQTAVRPKLKPATQGEWDFDFSQSIVEDIDIEWK